MADPAARRGTGERGAFDAPDPIALYLDALRHSLRNQSDADELVAEAEDHLREATTRRSLAGEDEARAQELVLRDFGDSSLVARALVRSRLHKVPQATALTRAAGVAGRWAGVGWLAALAANLYQISANPWLQENYVQFQLICALCTSLTLVLVIGLLARAGALGTVSSAVAMLFGLVALAGNTTVTWMWPLTNAALALALWIAVLECRRAGHPLGSGEAHVVALVWPLAFAVALLGRYAQLGPVDAWGEYSMLYDWAFPVAAALFGVGCWLVGSRLASEPLPVLNLEGDGDESIVVLDRLSPSVAEQPTATVRQVDPKIWAPPSDGAGSVLS